MCKLTDEIDKWKESDILDKTEEEAKELDIVKEKYVPIDNIDRDKL